MDRYLHRRSDGRAQPTRLAPGWRHTRHPVRRLRGIGQAPRQGRYRTRGGAALNLGASIFRSACAAVRSRPPYGKVFFNKIRAIAAAAIPTQRSRNSSTGSNTTVGRRHRISGSRSSGYSSALANLRPRPHCQHEIRSASTPCDSAAYRRFAAALSARTFGWRSTAVVLPGGLTAGADSADTVRLR
jgi:hypothetical protein